MPLISLILAIAGYLLYNQHYIKGKRNMARSLGILFIIIVFNPFGTSAAVFTTVSNGDWNDPLVWDAGSIPTPDDDIIINHIIISTANISIGKDGKLTIGDFGRLNFTNIQLIGVLRNDGSITGDLLRVEDAFANPNVNMENYGRARITDVIIDAQTAVRNRNKWIITNNLTISGFFNNLRNLIVEGRVYNDGGFRCQETYSLLTVGREFNNTINGDVELEGKIKLGLTDDSGNPLPGLTTFLNDGIIQGLLSPDPGSKPGLFDGGNTVNIINNNAIGGLSDLYLCIGVQSTYQNNSPPDDFVIDCCVTQIADAGADRLVCSGDNITFGGTPTATGGTAPYTYSWTTSGGGSLITTTDANPQGSTTGSNTRFDVVVTDFIGCESRDIVNIKRTTSVIASAGIDKTICQGESVIIGDATTPASCGTGPYTYLWSPATGLDDPTAANPNASPTVTTEYVLRVTDSGPTENYDAMTVYVDPTPTVANAGTNKNVCGTSTALEANAAATGTGTWSIASGTGGNIADLNDNNSAFTGTAGTTYQLTWTISSGSCPGSSDQVTITFDQNPTTANAGSNKSVCGTSTTLEANTATIGTGSWSIVSGSGGSIAPADDENGTFTGTVGTIYQLRWTISNGGCTSSEDDVTITLDQTPTTADAGPDQNVCGNSTVLEGNTATIGTGTWSIISGTGGNITDLNDKNSAFTGTAGASYQLRWTIANGSCASSEDDVMIAFDQTPTIANAGTNKSVCGTSTNLEGITATIGTGTWSIISGTGGNITDLNDENSPFSGTAGATYQLRWTIANGGCPSSTDDVNITFDQSPTTANAGTNKSVCGNSTSLEANTATIGTGTWSIISGLGGNVVAPNNENSSFTGTIGTTYQLRWTINNGSCTSSANDVSITFDQTPTTADAGTDKSVCGASTNLEANAAIAGTGTWSIISGIGGNVATLNNENSAFTGTPGVTYQLRWTIANGSCTSSEDDVLITFDQTPTTANAGPNKNVCGSTTLDGNPATTGTGSWSIITGTGGNAATPNDENSAFTGTPGTTYQLRWTITNGSCTSSEDDVLITFDQSPTTANAGANKNVCGNSTNLEANTATVGTGSWSIISGTGGNVATLNNENSAFTGTQGTTYRLRWTITNGSCTSSEDDVDITFDLTPTTANAGANKNVCGPTTLEGNTATTGTGNWSIISGTGGNVVTLNNENSAFTGTPGTTYQLRWTITNGSCTSSEDDVLITFDQTPTTANAGTNKNVCGNSTNLEANTATVGTGSWSIISGTGGNVATLNNENSAFTGTPGTTYQLRWTIANGTCTSSEDDVNITLDQVPTTADAGADKNVCGNSTNLEANAAIVGTGSWSIISGSGGNVATLNNENSIFTGTVGATYQLRWTITNGSCTSSEDDVIITFDQSPTVADAGMNKSACGTSTNLEANIATVGNGSWSIISGTGGNVATLNDENSSFTGTPGATYQLRWTITNGSCTSSEDDVLITFDESPTISNAGMDKNICGTSTNLEGINATTGTGTWSIISGAGGNVATLNDENSTFTGTQGTTYQLTWTIANGSCTSSEDDVLITFDQSPTTANAGTDKNACGTSTNLEANTATIGTGTWSIISGASGNIAAPNNENSNFTGISGTTYQLRWTITNGSCTSSADDVFITFDLSPTIANAGVDKNICGNSTNLEANTASTGIGTWSVISGIGGSVATPNNENSNFTGTVGTTYQLRWTVANGSCTSSQDEVSITFDQTPTTADAGGDQNVCGNSTNLEANMAATGTGTWSIISGTGGIVAAPNNENSNFTGTPGTTYQLRWTIANGSCTSSQDEVVITFDQTPTTANAGTNKNVCATSTNLEANTATVGTGSWSIISGTGGNVVTPNDENSNFTGTIGTTYQLRWSISNGSCTNSEDDVTITFNQAPTVANAGTDKGICGTSTNLEANPATVGTGAWSIISGTGGNVVTLNDENSNFTGTAGATYQLRWTISNGSCINSQDEVTITFDQTPTIANAGSDQDVCGASTNLEGNIATIGTGSWSIVSGAGGTVTTPNDENSNFTGTIGTTYQLRWTIGNGSCTSSQDDVSITFNPVPVTANASSDQDVCGTSTTLEGNDPNGATGSWSVVSGDGLDSFTNQNLFNTDFSGTAGQTYVLRWTINSASCGTSTDDDVSITFNQAPTAANAGNDIDLCGDIRTTTLNANAPTVGTGIWRVTAGAGNIANPNQATTEITGLAVGQVTTVAWQISNGSCQESDELSINVQPAASVNINLAEICEGESVDIEITGGRSFRWNPVEGVSNGNTANPQLSPTISTNYELIISNGTCNDQIINVSVVVNPTPTAGISRDTTIQAGNSVQLFASGGDSYSWTPTDDLNNPVAPDPFASPTETITYAVEVSNEFGCLVRESVTVTVDDNYEIFVPQMFSPNGDGSNDILFVNTIGIETLTFKVFDRHGKLIFESGDGVTGWDGTINGEVQNIDTYVYLVAAKTYSNQNITDKGTFQLIR